MEPSAASATASVVVGGPTPTPTPTVSPVHAAEPADPPRNHHPRSLITVAETLVVTVVLIVVVAFVRSTSGPAHPATLSHDTGPPATTSVATSTTTAPVPAALSVDSQMSAWWSGTGEPATAALSADLQAVQQSGADLGALSASCAALARDSNAAAVAPPAPSTTVEREWQLAVSTSTRASAACETGRYTSLARDLQPASYTIHDLSDQVRPYLVG